VTSIAILVVVALVLAAGLVYNRRVWRPRQAAAPVPADGLKIWEVTHPFATLSMLLLVFVLVQTFASWSEAGTEETHEATATLLLFREADLIRSPQLRTEVRKEVVCYATSVIHQEWPAMGDSRESNVPSYWAGRIRGIAVHLVRGGSDPIAGENLVRRDGQRAVSRQDRLGEARSKVPDALLWLMVAAVVITLAIMASVTLNTAPPNTHLAIVVAAAIVFAGALVLIHDIDQPYSGWVKREPSQTEFVRDQIAPQVRGPLPCDAAGLPKNAPGFRPQTVPLS
jgi:amino acid transporter